MSLTKLTENLNNISSLPDKPNLPAEELKAEFDKAGNRIKEYINTTLTDEIDTAVTEITNRIISNEQLNEKLNNKTDKTKFVNIANTDLDNYKEEGTYYFETNFAPLNIPAGNNGWLKVLNRGKDEVFVKQVWYRMGTPNSNDTETYVRTFGGDSGWSVWERYVMKKDLSGTLAKFKNSTFTYKGFEANSASSWDYPEGFTKDHTKVLSVMEWDSATDTWKNNNTVTVRMGKNKISLENYNSSSTIQIMVFNSYPAF